MNEINEKQKSECHVRIHSKNKYLMSMDIDATPSEVITLLMEFQQGDA